MERHPTIAPITYQSQDISFSRWMSLLTLSLAPLIAHILAGAPRASYLTKHRPKWHEQLVHYNPTSILWRYASIADRRIRARAWDRTDIAAANAIFWTDDGWDGSESMVERSRSYCTHMPDHARIAFFSSEMIKTWIITLQGVQTISVLTRNLTGGNVKETFDRSLAVDFVFSPLSFIGLLRVFCALWLTDDFNYTSNRAISRTTELSQLGTESNTMRRSSMDSLLDSPNCQPLSGHRYRPTSFSISRAFRVFFLLLLLAMLATALLFLIGSDESLESGYYTATSFSVALFYVVFLAATSGICAVYFATGSSSTVIPCITAAWYKAYTVAIMAFAVATFIIACIETRETICGRFTSMGGLPGDMGSCGATDRLVIPLARDNSSAFGIASTARLDLVKNTPSNPGEIFIYDIMGMCLGDVKRTFLKTAILNDTIPWRSG
ncbi:hypothetical protein PG987_016118 [Apiospora arundinis]